MLKIINVLLFCLVGVAAATASAESLFMTCTRVSPDDYSYDVKVYRTTAWERLDVGYRAEQKTNAVRTDKQGKKAVRNYASAMNYYNDSKRLVVFLSKRSTSYGLVVINFTPSGNIKNAYVTTAANVWDPKQGKALNCKLLEKPKI